MECTIVRVGDTFRDETALTGHATRPQDLERIADLGITTVRYPVLWETVAPDSPASMDWRWPDERLASLRRLGITPIVGLVHHGSGPRYTDLLDPNFPALLADYAARVAERYPWVEWFTPVNEPLTTARFSGLYGHWYPHGRDERTFLRALVNECVGIARSMQAIRRITPHAALVQTEDIGKTFASPALAYQADYENERRWLGFDLLFGKVDRTHPFFARLIRNGITERELASFVEAPCPPDIIGANHYLTSERYLDERTTLYPKEFHGGNGLHRYADVEAVRIDLPDGATGPKARLADVWHRYRRPVAVTEVHHGCSRDEQLRWLHEVWSAAVGLRREGADIRAVTVWSLFGAVDWNSLLTRGAGFYEPGAFDVRTTTPRETALAQATRQLALHGKFDHPVLDRPGWWRRHGRLYEAHRPPSTPPMAGEPRRLLITGATGTLGGALARICEARGLAYEIVSRAELDIADEQSAQAAIAGLRPWAVVNAAGYVRVADAVRERERCSRENVDGADVLARTCERFGIPLVTFSSDLVFDGRSSRPYVESDQPSPLCVYGRSKADAEELVLGASARALVVRSSAFFGPWDRYNFVHHVLSALRLGRRLEARADEIVSPTYVPDLAEATLDLLIDGETGVWHLANGGSCSWYEFAVQVAAKAGMDTRLVVPITYGARDTSLTSERGLLLSPLDDAIDRYLRAHTAGSTLVEMEGCTA